MSSEGPNPLVSFFKLRVLFRANQHISNLDKERFQVTASAGDTCRLDLAVALILARTTSSLGDKVF